MRGFAIPGLIIAAAVAGAWAETRFGLISRIESAWTERNLAALFVERPLAAAASGSGDTVRDRRVLYYRNPMGLSDTSPVPKKDSMGMDYVPVLEDETSSGATVTIAPEVVQNLGVRTARPQRDRLEYRINTFGNIALDESRIGHVHIRTRGWVEHLAVNSIGEAVKTGDLLFELYSPELVTAQEEFIQALALGNERLTAASRQRLLALGVTGTLVNRLAETRVAEHAVRIVSHHTGVVTDLKVRDGMYVEPDMEAITLVDMRSMWLIAEVPERESTWVRTGQAVEARLPSLPGRTWGGTVDLVYPVLESSTRTLRLRMRFDNPDGFLKPNMFAEVSILASADRPSLNIPREALIRERRGDHVIVALGDGRYAARPVIAGIASGERIEVREGLTESDEVVVSGQFLIDSEASLRASFNRIEAGGHHHEAGPQPAIEAMTGAAAEPPAAGRSPPVPANGHEGH